VAGNGDSVRGCGVCLVDTDISSIANMKVITSIYLNCRPDLRDEWLTGIETDDAGDAQVTYQTVMRTFSNSFQLGPRTSPSTPSQVL